MPRPAASMRSVYFLPWDLNEQFSENTGKTCARGEGKLQILHKTGAQGWHEVDIQGWDCLWFGSQCSLINSWIYAQGSLQIAFKTIWGARDGIGVICIQGKNLSHYTVSAAL